MDIDNDDTGAHRNLGGENCLAIMTLLWAHLQATHHQNHDERPQQIILKQHIESSSWWWWLTERHAKCWPICIRGVPIIRSDETFQDGQTEADTCRVAKYQDNQLASQPARVSQSISQPINASYWWQQDKQGLARPFHHQRHRSLFLCLCPCLCLFLSLIVNDTTIATKLFTSKKNTSTLQSDGFRNE